MVNELDRWAQRKAGLVPSREQRQQTRAIANLVHETKFAGTKVDAEAVLAGRIMDRVVDLDAYRRQLAGDDPVLDAILASVEMAFVEKTARHQKNFGSEFPS